MSKVTEEMVTRFLNWPLPKSVLPDPCVMDREYPYRVGTNLLTAIEARAMLEHVLCAKPVPCSRCNGRGKVPVLDPDDGYSMHGYATCPDCGGGVSPLPPGKAT